VAWVFINVGFLSIKLHAVSCTQVVKTCYKLQIITNKQCERWNIHTKNILWPWISAVCINKFEYMSITCPKLLVKDYSLPPLISPFSSLSPLKLLGEDYSMPPLISPFSSLSPQTFRSLSLHHSGRPMSSTGKMCCKPNLVGPIE